MRFLTKVLATGLALAAMAAAAPSIAQDYPNGTVAILVGSAPGGSADTNARFLAEQLSQQLGQTFIVENRPGASGLVAAVEVGRAEPDGQTLMFATQANLVVAPILNPENAANLQDVLVGAAPFGNLPMVLVIDPDLPIHSVQELIDYANANPGVLNYGSGGVGTTPHLTASIFAQQAGIDLAHITYQGENPAVLDVLGKRLQVMFASPGAVRQHVETGGLRALAVTSDQPIPAFPDLPTIAETLPGYNVQSWSGLVAPAGTPQAVLDTINSATAAALETPAASEMFANAGLLPFNADAAGFQEHILSEAARWRQVLQPE